MGNEISLGKDSTNVELVMAVQGERFDLTATLVADRAGGASGDFRTVRIWEEAAAETAFRAGVEMALHAAVALRGERIAALREDLADDLNMVVGP